MSFVARAHCRRPIVIAAVAFAAPAVASAQATSDQGLSPPAAEASTSRKAIGVTIDLLPIVLSASAGEVGLSGQLWGAIDHYRLRLVGAHLTQPDWLAAKGGFEERRTTAFAVIGDYLFGDNFDGFWVGGGFEYWHESIGHEEAPGERDSWDTVAATAGGGYIWRVVGNFFLEPWTAAHLRLTPASASLAGETYEPQWLSAEVSLKIGFFVEL